MKPRIGFRSFHLQCITTDGLLDTRTGLEAFQKEETQNAPKLMKENSSNCQKPTATSKSPNSVMTDVVYVAPGNAKQLKSVLETKGWLDKRFRMTKVASIPSSEPEDNTSSNFPAIAVPICISLSVVLDECKQWILSHGQLEMPYSTSQFASGKRRGK